jgi:hypothetical protein
MSEVFPRSVVGFVRSIAAPSVFALLLSTTLSAAGPVALAGQMAGRVTTPGGVPQMGAAVSIFNSYERLVARIVTGDTGNFEFTGLPAGLYALQVTSPSFVPVFRRNISVQSGMRSYIGVNLSTLLSTIEFIYLAPGQRSLMSEEWKWVLRGSGSTRPVLRLLPLPAPRNSPAPQVAASWFRDTEGVLRVSAGEGSATTNLGTQADLGTAFAVATSVFGSHRVELAGNVGYSSNIGLPTAGFRTTVATPTGGQIGLTMRQVSLGGRSGLGQVTGGNAPALRTYEMSYSDSMNLAQDLLFEFGATLESVVFLDRLNFVSPYGRLSWGTPEDGMIRVGYSSGAPPMKLLRESSSAASLQDGLSTLAMFPRVSLASGQAKVQRSENMEVGYTRTQSGRTFAISAYQETLSNAAALLVGADGTYRSADLLPDLGSQSSIFNYGNYVRRGYTLAMTQEFSDFFNATVGYTYAGALAGPSGELPSEDPNDLRAALGHPVYRHGLLARAGGAIPLLGTVYNASYQWTDYGAFQPVHYSLVQQAQFDSGLNVSVRQPIPRVAGVFPGRVEATADLRNLLAQGYIGAQTPAGRRMMLIHSPRTIRGGLSFIF